MEDIIGDIQLQGAAFLRTFTEENSSKIAYRNRNRPAYYQFHH